MDPELIKVVVIDDDKEDFQIIQTLLKDVEGVRYQVRWISNFEQGVEELRAQTADIYLIDYRLNGKTGFELIDQLPDHTFAKPMILLTGFGSRELDVRAMEKGVSNFLAKDNLTADSLERSIRYGVKRAEDEERLRSTERLKAEKEVAESANRAKSLFLANITHEIRTPLSAILGFADLALEQKTDEKERLTFLKVIRKNGQHLLELVNDALDLSKIEAGRLDVRKEFCDWRNTINETVELFKPQTESKNITLRFVDQPSLPKGLYTEPHYFRQILLNIVGNAVKFTNFGGILISVEHGNSTGCMLKFIICDTGIGIEPEDHCRLFEPFTQGSNKPSHEYGGTGLGLNLSKKLAAALDGDLELVESKTSHGSTFSFSVPACFVSNSAISTENLVIPLDVHGASLKVLVIDDNPDNQILVSHILSGVGIRAEGASNAKNGIDRALNESFDAVVMDIQMPQMDGIEATKKLRSSGFTKPIIALSAYGPGAEREAAMQAGVSEYLTKPIQREKLISSLLNLKRESSKAEREVSHPEPG